jgi:ethanolamine ammonia-lyase small subunit
VILVTTLATADHDQTSEETSFLPAAHPAIQYSKAPLEDPVARLGRQLVLASAASDRTAYLRRPDLGRQLDQASARSLKEGNWDAALVIADGLSATAVHRHAKALIDALMPELEGWRLAPTCIARQGRVAIGDEIGARLGARLVVMLIGERPGLSAPDSLGAYLTWAPRVERTDAERNFVSNIRDGGLEPVLAAQRIAALMCAARDRQMTGVNLNTLTQLK